MRRIRSEKRQACSTSEDRAISARSSVWKASLEAHSGIGALYSARIGRSPWARAEGARARKASHVVRRPKRKRSFISDPSDGFACHGLCWLVRRDKPAER